MPESSPPLLTVRALKGADATPGRAFSGVLVVRKLAEKTASNGNPFLSAEFGDRTGSFTSTVFSDNAAFEALKGLEEGAVVRVEGKVDSYQGRLSPKIARVTPLSPGELAAPEVIENLVETAPEDSAALWAEFNGFVDAIGRPELRATVRQVVEDAGDSLRTAPAASSMHHAYRHGLLEHTVHMARAARALLALYTEVDGDLAMAGILLHDIGKTLEYEGSLAPRRSRRGILHGHVVLGYQLVRRAALKAKLDPERTERLEHVILSHQGKLEWGAATLAATPEAVFVSMIDNLDAKMGMVQRALRNSPAGEDFSERVPGLDGQQLLLRKLPG